MVHVVLFSLYVFRKLSNKISGYIHSCMHSNLLTLGKKFHPGAHPSFLCIKHAMDGMLVHRRVTPQQYVAGTHFTHLREKR